MSEWGQTEKNSVGAHVFRFALEIRHCSMQSACLKTGQKRTPDAAAAYWRTEWHGQQLLRWSKVSTDPGGMTHESADCCGPAVPRLERARSRGYVRLRLQRRGRRYRDVHAASGRFAAAGAALQGEQARDA